MALAALRRYARWLHLDVPAGRVERLPVVAPDGTTRLPRVYVTGDLTGVPLLKFAADSGAAAVERIDNGAAGDDLDLVILGGGVSGMAAALAAGRKGLRFLVLEAATPFATVADYPARKPIFTYPAGMTPRGDLQVTADVKEALLDELRAQVRDADLPVVLGVAAAGLRRAGDAYEIVLKDGAAPRPWRGTDLPAGWRTPLRARHVIVALGRSGDARQLGVPGEDRPKVFHRLLDPAAHRGRDVLVVGGGDSALEAAVALADAGARVTLSYRGRAFARPKAENRAALARRPAVAVMPGTEVREIREEDVVLATEDGPRTVRNDAVFALIGRDPPLAFFRRSGIPIAGEMTPGRWAAFLGFVALCALLYLWKAGALPGTGLEGIGARDPRTLLGATVGAARDPGFWYTLAYSLCVVVFGLRRIRRRPTPYIRLQTYTLMAIQVVPLFVLPQILLPWLDANGWLSGWIEHTFFPGKSWWRAYGLVLAWPLFFWNLATDQPIWGWVVLSVIQTAVLVPLLVRRWGKGAYCGWICPCGALAETLGDRQRRKMWHGPAANRWNLLGQAVLLFALVALAWRALGWALPAGNIFTATFAAGFATPWKWVVDLTLAGVVGLGFYFHFSGRVWCRFACPLAALMHVYAKLTRYRIFAEKDRCISCNLCTTVCHQGIDVMGFANRGRPLTDVQCVRCSACVAECPTGTLSFGRADAQGRPAALDRPAASPVHLRDGDMPGTILGRLQRQADGERA